MADMSNEEAARVLTELADAYSKHELTAEAACISALRMGAAALRGWVKTADRLPEGDEHFEVLGLYKGTDYLLYDIVQLGWLRLHPEMYPYWTLLPGKLEVEG